MVATQGKLFRTSILPKSVIDIGQQDQSRRRHGDHDNVSSRADYSHFPDEVASICCELYLRDCKVIADPFAGWGERHKAIIDSGKTYFGFDCNPVAIEKAREEYGVENTLACSLTCEIPEFDGLLTCPPYWNLERYSRDGIENEKTFDSFCEKLETIFLRFYGRASVGTMFCVMVSDWRKDHVFHDMTYRTQRMFYNAGATPIDDVVLDRSKVSKIKIMIPQALRLGYTVKVHERLLVFRKDQPTNNLHPRLDRDAAKERMK